MAHIFFEMGNKFEDTFLTKEYIQLNNNGNTHKTGLYYYYYRKYIICLIYMIHIFRFIYTLSPYLYKKKINILINIVFHIKRTFSRSLRSCNVFTLTSLRISLCTTNKKFLCCLYILWFSSPSFNT